jgi:uncharacterized protein YceK
MRRLAIVTAMILIMVTLGCASYYKVTDPATGKDYYTDTVERKGGSVTFKDVNTRATVTLPTSEVMEISKDQFEANTGEK